MKTPWLPQGSSDPISYTCTCSCSSSSETGVVLLFYRYFASPPVLPAGLITEDAINELASFHTNLTTTLNLGGKIRVGKEGFNITVGGTQASISSYIEACASHWSFSGLGLGLVLDDNEAKGGKRDAFFKPSSGCACVFGGLASVRMCEEITPMGVTNYSPTDWGIVKELSPSAFHDMCLEEKVVLVDVRNYYESRIGFFVDGRGREAVRPAVRRFGQWPLWVRSGQLERSQNTQVQNREEQSAVKEVGEKRYLTYCTGGIRCEKGARFLAENLPASASGSGGKRVYTLKGGIQAYLMWMDSEMAAGRMTAEESLFKGKNYVFDARGSTSVSERYEGEKVARCHVCQKPEDRLSKCRSRGCHLILVVCEGCEEGDVRCCVDCGELERLVDVGTLEKRGICACEQGRERSLWGDRPLKSKQSRKMIRKNPHACLGINIQIKTVD